MATKQFLMPEVGTVTLYKRRGNRSLRLSIGSNGEVRVSLPYWLPYKAGEQFALARASWILENRPALGTMLRHGLGIGKAHRLVFEKSSTTGTVHTKVIANEVRIRFPDTYLSEDPIVQDAARKASIRALKKEAEVLLPQRLQALASQTGHTYTTVSVKQLRSRWGSCSSKQEITLNLFLMQLPWHLIDYVLVHELTHTKVMQHGAPFWREMERFLPGARQLRKQMANHQPMLSPNVRSVA